MQRTGRKKLVISGNLGPLGWVPILAHCITRSNISSISLGAGDEADSPWASDLPHKTPKGDPLSSDHGGCPGWAGKKGRAPPALSAGKMGVWGFPYNNA